MSGGAGGGAPTLRTSGQAESLEMTIHTVVDQSNNVSRPDQNYQYAMYPTPENLTQRWSATCIMIITGPSHTIRFLHTLTYLVAHASHVAGIRGDTSPFNTLKYTYCINTLTECVCF